MEFPYEPMVSGAPIEVQIDRAFFEFVRMHGKPPTMLVINGERYTQLAAACAGYRQIALNAPARPKTYRGMNIYRSDDCGSFTVGCT